MPGIPYDRILAAMLRACPVVLSAVMLLLSGGCAAPPIPADPESPLAVARLRALRDREWTESDADLRILIEQLDHPDPAVRMVASDILLRLTGESMGFRYDAPVRERNEAVERWVRWLRTRTAIGASAGEGGVETESNG